MAIDVVVLDCSGVIFFWLLGSLEIFPAPLPATLPGHPGHEYDPASASKFAQRAGSADENLLVKDYFLPLPPLFFETSLPTFSTFVRFFLSFRLVHSRLCHLGPLLRSFR